MIKTFLDNGFLYYNSTKLDELLQPILFIHGVGGHHGNYNAFNKTYLLTESNFIPYYSDLPGYGFSDSKNLCIDNINSFLSSSINYINYHHKKKVVLSISSAGLWLIDLALYQINKSLLILDNPLKKHFFRDTDFVNNKINIRQKYMALFMDDISLKIMNKDKLGKPEITKSFYKQIINNNYEYKLNLYDKIIAFYCSKDMLKPNHFIKESNNFMKIYLPSRSHTIYNRLDAKIIIRKFNELFRN